MPDLLLPPKRYEAKTPVQDKTEPSRLEIKVKGAEPLKTNDYDTPYLKYGM